MRYLVILLLTSTLLAGGWNKKKNTIFAKYEFRMISATKWYDFSGDAQAIPDYSSITHSLYSEYGITDNITFIANLPVIRSLEFGASENSGLGDVVAGIRYGISQDGPVVFALSLNASFDTGSFELSNPPLATDVFTPTGAGSNSYLIGIEMGQSFYPVGAYMTAFAGFNIRSGDFISNELQFGAEFGYDLSDKLLAIIKLRHVTALDDLVVGISPQIQSEYSAFAVEAAYKLDDNYGFTAAFDGALQAKNNFSAPTISFGIFFNSN